MIKLVLLMFLNFINSCDPIPPLTPEEQGLVMENLHLTISHIKSCAECDPEAQKAISAFQSFKIDCAILPEGHAQLYKFESFDNFEKFYAFFLRCRRSRMLVEFENIETDAYDIVLKYTDLISKYQNQNNSESLQARSLARQANMYYLKSSPSFVYW
jgi:hypothetical protein